MDFAYSQPIATADVPNANRRIYPKAVLESIVKQFQQLPKDGLVGQLGMPDDSIIHLSLASHLVKDLRVDDQQLVADIQVLTTENGKRLAEMLDNGEVAFRLQGIGNGEVNADEVLVIGDSYKLITVNAVPAWEAA